MGGERSRRGVRGKLCATHQCDGTTGGLPQALSSSDMIGKMTYDGRVGNLEAELGTAKWLCVPLEMEEAESEWRKGHLWTNGLYTNRPRFHTPLPEN